MRGAGVVVLVALAGAASPLAACVEDTVVLATIPGDDAGSPEQHLPIRCTSSADCQEPNTFCAKDGCGAVTGTCAQIPVDCPQQEDPVCGCDDGVTYFSDCVRKTYGVAAATNGSCPFESATICGGSYPACPNGTTCAHLFGFGGPPDCPPPPNPPGVCWGLPPVCPPQPSSMSRWSDACGGPRCLDTCNAIKNGGVFHHENQCPQ